MINDFYIEKEFFSDQEINEIINKITGDNRIASIRTGGSYGDLWKPLSEFTFMDFFQHSNLHIERISQAFLTFEGLYAVDAKKVLKFVSDKYNLKVEELECDSGQIQVYPPGSFIEPHSDKDYEGNLKVCAVLIPLNSRPENANGGELVIGDYEYVPNKGDIITITMDTDTLHQVNHVKDWFRFVLTILVKEKL